MKNLDRMAIVLIAIAYILHLFLFHSAEAAETKVYRCDTESGVTFSQSPCDDSTEPIIVEHGASEAVAKHDVLEYAGSEDCHADFMRERKLKRYIAQENARYINRIDQMDKEMDQLDSDARRNVGPTTVTASIRERIEAIRSNQFALKRERRERIAELRDELSVLQADDC